MRIYLLMNTVNGKHYVGQTSQQRMNRRVNGHRASASKPTTAISHAIAKYGWDAFTVETLEECVDHTDLDMAERFWIATYNSLSPNGYNLETGGCSRKTVHPDVVERVASKNRGQKRTPEQRARNSAANKGRKLSEEHKRLIGLAGAGRPVTDATRLKMSEAQRGRATGEANPRSVMTWEIVREIRRRYAAGGVTQAVLAAEAGVSQVAVGKVLRLKSWVE